MLKVSDAAKLLGFTNESEIQTYANEKGWKLIQKNNETYFNFKTQHEERSQLPTHRRIIREALQYAKELEKIV